jgi:hypothetical protein
MMPLLSATVVYIHTGIHTYMHTYTQAREAAPKQAPPTRFGGSRFGGSRFDGSSPGPTLNAQRGKSVNFFSVYVCICVCV